MFRMYSYAKELDEINNRNDIVSQYAQSILAYLKLLCLLGNVH